MLKMHDRGLVISKAEKKLTGCNPVIKKRALMVVEKAYDSGIEMLITDAYRSIAEQNKIYAQGRTTAGKIVTNAKGGSSYHNYGLAFDFCLVDGEGLPYWIVNEKWLAVVKIAKEYGFEWGGDWTSFKDYPHFQITGGKSCVQLMNGALPFIPELKKEADNVSVSNWKDDIMKQGIKLGLIDETHKADDVATKWFVVALVIKANGLLKK